MANASSKDKHGKRGGREFSLAMDEDPNMGMNPYWRMKRGLPVPEYYRKEQGGKKK